MTDEVRNDLMREFYITIIGKELPNIFGCNWLNTRVIGAGTAGFIVGFSTPTSQQMYDGFQRLEKQHFDRKYKSENLIKEDMPDVMAVKIQLFYDNKPYFEARALREAFNCYDNQ
jgi:hypothetical protein